MGTVFLSISKITFEIFITYEQIAGFARNHGNITENRLYTASNLKPHQPVFSSYGSNGQNMF